MIKEIRLIAVDNHFHFMDLTLGWLFLKHLSLHRSKLIEYVLNSLIPKFHFNQYWFSAGTIFTKFGLLKKMYEVSRF